MDIQTLITFASFCLLLNITPGPDMLLIASRSVYGGRMVGFATYFGVALGAVVFAASGLRSWLSGGQSNHRALGWFQGVIMFALAGLLLLRKAE